MFTRINGHLLNTVAFGSGPRTLVAHGGWVGSWELWQQPFELLSDEWRCISYDHRGTGESPVSPEQITPEALVDDLFAVLDAYGVRRCVLAGESLGTLVVLGAAARRPERFEGLVLVDGGFAVSEQLVRPLIDGARRDWPATAAWFAGACGTVDRLLGESLSAPAAPAPWTLSNVSTSALASALLARNPRPGAQSGSANT